MQQHVIVRTIQLAHYLLDTNCTLRTAAKHFGIGKSTAHVDLTKRLAKLDKQLYVEVSKVLQTNKQTRHLRGGEATKRKYRLQHDTLNLKNKKA